MGLAASRTAQSIVQAARYEAKRGIQRSVRQASVGYVRRVGVNLQIEREGDTNLIGRDEIWVADGYNPKRGDRVLLLQLTAKMWAVVGKLTDEEASRILTPLPAGGANGHVLTKASAADYDIAWTASPAGLPAGGSTGQMLTKSSATNFDVGWTTPPVGLPTGGSTGAVLRKVSGTDHDVEWAQHPSLVTSLPTPTLGRTVFYNVGSGIVWHLVCYDPNATYPWAFVGGPPLSALVAASEQRTATGYGDLATVGPSITLPLPGDYDVKIGARIHSSTANKENWMSYQIGATAASDTDALDTHSGPSGTFSHTSFHSYREKRKTGLSAVTLTCKYKIQDSGDGAWWTERSISATPVRVAGS
jgi:hypothetical protein